MYVNFELWELCYDQDYDRVVRFYAGSVEIMRVGTRDQIFYLNAIEAIRVFR